MRALSLLRLAVLGLQQLAVLGSWRLAVLGSWRLAVLGLRLELAMLTESRRHRRFLLPYLLLLFSLTL